MSLNGKLLTAFFTLLCQQPTLKLVSAMKGGREKNGVASSPSENRHVKWAPDVYDPPVTSVCHSVTNSYQRRSKHRKKEKNKQKKRQKGKSKKNQQQSSAQNPSAPQVPGIGPKGVSTTGGQSPADDLSEHEAGIMDYSMGSQEANCGSSFLRESVAKMHFSTAEAS
ncbi:BRI1-KD interacting protein 130 [Zea mays]|uniref:BRI1-KD interacting protein 130 n=1 Tax=Zea mays TaxID=4577 RepID=A0A1D6LHL8_MAIZE|nr:BRI1-KD interacting protein 130 [Zea mays]AQK79369.1 BRI1-KD interacting protein 130 [Zea mays]AQK79376.1 BRI1-KD interacting protein 130 [Zea mays]